MNFDHLLAHSNNMFLDIALLQHIICNSGEISSPWMVLMVIRYAHAEELAIITHSARWVALPRTQRPSIPQAHSAAALFKWAPVACLLGCSYSPACHTSTPLLEYGLHLVLPNKDSCKLLEKAKDVPPDVLGWTGSKWWELLIPSITALFERS